MAKQSPNSTPETSTLSTRFNARQREAVERAASIANCTPAKLIRESAVTRAAEILNTRGSAGTSLRALAAKALQPMINPVVEVEFFGGHPDHGETRKYSIAEWDRIRSCDEGLEIREFMGRRGYEDYRVRPVRPEMHEIREIKTALGSCPSEFATYMLEQWEAVESGGQRYTPQVSAAELLSGEDADGGADDEA